MTSQQKAAEKKRGAFLQSLAGGFLLVEPKMETLIAWGREEGLVQTFRAGEFVAVRLTKAGRAKIDQAPAVGTPAA